MIDIERIATNLESPGEGLWRSRTRSRVSYPVEGNTWWFPIETESFWFRHRNRCILEAVRRFPPGGAVFDVGGGNGIVSLALSSDGMETVLVEPGEEGIQNARSRGLAPLICSTLEDAGFRERSLPAIGCFDVLEHVEDDTGFLGLARRLLVPGGRLYLTVPAYRTLWSVEDDHAGHRRRYRLGPLTRRLRGLGFGIEHGTYLFSPLPLPILLARTLPSRLGLRRKFRLRRERREHGVGRGTCGRLLEWALDRELGVLRRGRKLPVGSSCLVVARAPD